MKKFERLIIKIAKQNAIIIFYDFRIIIIAQKSDTENIVLKNIHKIIQTISFKLSYRITQTRETILPHIISYLLSVTTCAIIS